MEIKRLSDDRREEWNSFVAKQPSFSLLQSWEWGEFKTKLGWKAFRIAAEDQGKIVAGAQILIKFLPLWLFSMAYIPRGPVGNWLEQEIAPKLLSECHRVARYQKAIFLKIEPPLLNQPPIHQTIQEHGFRASRYTNQPRATIILDLAQDPDTIFKQFRKKTRQYIRKAVRDGVTVSVGGDGDFSAFYDLMRITGRREYFPPRSRAYYAHEWQTFADKKQTVLLMAFDRDKLLSVRTAYHFGRYAAEFHAGSLDKDTILHSNYLLVWEAIKWAKAQGCCTYDLWGIPDEVGQAISGGKEPPVSDRTDGLWGVYRFKSGFGKNIVYYIGSYDYVYRPLLYKLITNKLINSARMERIAVCMDTKT
jgi:lipid II:glycine glycyltransferase (peptidoglycan interpeptide bridge formation enzyme)